MQKLKVTYKEYNFGNDNVLREYCFCIFNPNTASNSNMSSVGEYNENNFILNFTSDHTNQITFADKRNADILDS
jgi:hypothetical protein